MARSDLWGLTAVGAEVVLCAPPTLFPVGLDPADRDGSAELPEIACDRPALPPLTFETNLDRAIEGADVVIALRMQLERQQSGLVPSLREYSRLYQVNGQRLARAAPGAFVMHPGPMNEGIEISADVAHGARSLVEEQVANGVAVRMALLYLLARGRP